MYHIVQQCNLQKNVDLLKLYSKNWLKLFFFDIVFIGNFPDGRFIILTISF